MANSSDWMLKGGSDLLRPTMGIFGEEAQAVEETAEVSEEAEQTQAQ